ncbi:hypothetical protein Mapa_004480 [Marchantia paleacea]|nr:hypothetical protein Mapa_004480 [Marchantia paleacea]
MLRRCLVAIWPHPLLRGETRQKPVVRIAYLHHGLDVGTVCRLYDLLSLAKST